jgi:hypothetical protein
MRIVHSMIALVLLSPFISLGAQQPPQTRSSPRTAVTVGSMFSSYPKLEAQAKEISDAFVRKDFQRLMELTYPKLIQMAGGKGKFMKGVAEETKQQEAQGFKILSSTPTDVIQFLKVSGSLYAVMPTTLRANMRGDLFESYGCMIGISNDKGEHWTFIDAGRQGVRDFFPNVVDKLSLCPAKRAVQLTNH